MNAERLRRYSLSLFCLVLTQAEPGCISFVVEQDANNPHRYNVAEEFVDAVAFKNHQTRVLRIGAK